MTNKIKENTAFLLIMVFLVANISCFLVLYGLQQEARRERHILQQNQDELECILLEIPYNKRSIEMYKKVCG